MSFTFTLRSANRIGNLTCDRLDVVYDSIYDTRDHYDAAIDFLTSYADVMCTGRMKKYHAEVLRVRDLIIDHGFDGDRHGPAYCEDQWNDVTKAYDCDVAEGLHTIETILNEYPVKALLLPQVRRDDDGGYADDYMVQQSTLEKLMAQDTKQKCLILQPRERSTVDRVTIFNVFPYFERALREIERWPAVLFWDHAANRSVSVPVSSESDLEHVFSLAQGENPFDTLEEYAATKFTYAHYYLQLSDLHFGPLRARKIQPPLEKLITHELDSLDKRDSFDFIVTGDLVDSPTPASLKSTQSFIDFLYENGNGEPMFVLGNHDINRRGLALRNKNQRWYHIAGGYPKLVMADDIGMIFMLFNSNTRGFLAQGEIGKQQMDSMREKLAAVEGLEHYTLTAVLHHHVAAASYYKELYGNEQWLKEVGSSKGKERFKRLKDAEPFLDFLEEHSTRFVIHGHKHSPLIIDRAGIYVIACGSSVGRNKDYVSYNVLKFSNRVLTCQQFVESLPGAKKQKRDVMTLAIDY